MPKENINAAMSKRQGYWITDENLIRAKMIAKNLGFTHNEKGSVTKMLTAIATQEVRISHNITD